MAILKQDLNEAILTDATNRRRYRIPKGITLIYLSDEELILG